jgi:hypothetical protein
LQETSDAVRPLYFRQGGTVAGTVTFSGAGGILYDLGGAVSAVISGFAATDEIDLAAVAYDAADTVGVEKAGVVTVATQVVDASISWHDGGNGWNMGVTPGLLRFARNDE